MAWLNITATHAYGDHFACFRVSDWISFSPDNIRIASERTHKSEWEKEEPPKTEMMTMIDVEE